MTFDRIALAALAVTALGFGIWQHDARAASPSASLVGVDGTIDPRGNATVWVFGSDHSVRVCSALIPATADQKPTCSKPAALP